MGSSSLSVSEKVYFPPQTKLRLFLDMKRVTHGPPGNKGRRSSADPTSGSEIVPGEHIPSSTLASARQLLHGFITEDDCLTLGIVLFCFLNLCL